MGYQDQKNIELLDQFKQLNANLENICEQLCILSWQHEQQLKEKGIFVIEVPHLYNIFKDNQYDNIFHEHLGFHSLKSIKDL